MEGIAGAPTCPKCERELEGTLDTWRLPTEREGFVVLVMCPKCGHVLGTLPWQLAPDRPVRD